MKLPDIGNWIDDTTEAKAIARIAFILIIVWAVVTLGFILVLNWPLLLVLIIPSFLIYIFKD